MMAFAANSWAIDTNSMQKSADSMKMQAETIKKDVMAKCVQVKKSEATCTELMKSCPDTTKLQACMSDKMGTAVH
ncbi:hypothetical protein D3C87_2137480 [compost metagenome]